MRQRLRQWWYDWSFFVALGLLVLFLLVASGIYWMLSGLD